MQSIRLPEFPGRHLGVGLDLPWGAPIGFEASDRPTTRIGRFFARHGHRFDYAFASWQPRDRSVPRVAGYAQAWDAFMALEGLPSIRALHHTGLNLGAVEPYERQTMVALANGLADRYKLAWVNEDLGLWSLRGKRLPYPLPPYLTPGSLKACIRAVAETNEALDVPLLMEFPGFTEGAGILVGDLHPYDFFHEIARSTGVAVNLDIGHLLGCQWLRGRRGEELYDELDRLPLEHCFEVHLSGAAILKATGSEDPRHRDGRLVDAHHGLLLDEQLELLERILPLMPNAHAVCYEDPRFDAEGRLSPRAEDDLRRLEGIVSKWASDAPRPPPELRVPDCGAGDDDAGATDERLYAALHGRGPARGIASDDGEPLRMATQIQKGILTLRHRGFGGLRKAFPKTLASWIAGHPDDLELTDLIAAFVASDAYLLIGETAPGVCVEEAFYRFISQVEGVQASRSEMLAAVMAALAVNPDPVFHVLDGGFTQRNTMWVAVDGGQLIAAIPGRGVVRRAARKEDDAGEEPAPS